MGVLLQKDYLEISRIDKNVFLSISNLEIFIRQFIKMVLYILKWIYSISFFSDERGMQS